MGKEADSAVDMEGTLHKKTPRFACVYSAYNDAPHQGLDGLSPDEYWLHPSCFRDP